MKKITILLALICFALNTTFAQFQFLSPLPGSLNLPPEHNIVLRPGGTLDRNSVSKDAFTITGSRSGTHDFNLVICNDGKTINLNPTVPFAFDEVVSITAQKGIRTADGNTTKGYGFSFTTHREWTNDEKENMSRLKDVLLNEEIQKWDHTASGNNEDNTRGITGMFTISTNNNPAPGAVFFDSWSGNFIQNKWTGNSVIASNGDSIYFRKLSSGPNDFQMGKTGLFDTYRTDLGRFDVLDSNFTIVDNYYAVNGYGTNNHELQLEANGNAFLIADEYQTVDMTVYKNSYSPNATVLGNVVQELDGSHNLLFEWRGFDHVTFNEAQHENLGASFIDYMHTNAIEQDNDGNILISSRHLEQIDKIDLSTGDFIWRLGGLHNQFNFANDPQKFSYQHDIRRLANGNITLFDDGNFHSPAKSFAKEYQLDEVNKTATLVWSYSLADIGGNPAYYFAMGSVQRLSNGNTFIDWGWRSQSSAPSYTEVTSAGVKTWELSLTDGGKNIVSYRAHKYQWTPCARPTFSKLSTKMITANSAQLKWFSVANKTQQYEVQYKKDVDINWIDKKVSPSTTAITVTGLSASTKYDWRVQSRCDTVANVVSRYTAIKTFTTKAQKDQVLTATSLVSLTVYPNPAHDYLTIRSEAGINSVRIINLLGEIEEYFRMNGKKDAVLSLSSLAAGNYLLEVTTAEGRSVSKVVVE